MKNLNLRADEAANEELTNQGIEAAGGEANDAPVMEPVETVAEPQINTQHEEAIEQVEAPAEPIVDTTNLD